MIEVLFKVLFILLVNCCCLANNVNIQSYNFIINNYIPSEITKYNLGPGVININNNYEKFIVSQNWVSDNLYFGGMISSDNKEEIDISYNFNLGYKANLIQNEKINIIYDISYHNNRLISLKNTWKKISIILNIENQLGLAYNYIFTRCKEVDIINDIKGCNQIKDNKYANYFNFDFYQKINDKYLINIGIKKIETFLYPYFSIRYNL